MCLLVTTEDRNWKRETERAARTVILQRPELSRGDFGFSVATQIRRRDAGATKPFPNGASLPRIFAGRSGAAPLRRRRPTWERQSPISQARLASDLGALPFGGRRKSTQSTPFRRMAFPGKSSVPLRLRCGRRRGCRRVRAGNGGIGCGASRPRDGVDEPDHHGRVGLGWRTRGALLLEMASPFFQAIEGELRIRLCGDAFDEIFQFPCVVPGAHSFTAERLVDGDWLLNARALVRRRAWTRGRLRSGGRCAGRFLRGGRRVPARRSRWGRL